jgi:hypothetical protein
MDASRSGAALLELARAEHWPMAAYGTALALVGDDTAVHVGIVMDRGMAEDIAEAYNDIWAHRTP